MQNWAWNSINKTRGQVESLTQAKLKVSPDVSHFMWVWNWGQERRRRRL